MKYKIHPSILTIQAKYQDNNKFSFTQVTTQDIEKIFFDLETKRASQISDIPTKIIKENVDVFVDFPCTSINSSIKYSLFTSCLKFADVKPLHKKERKDAKQNYRPVSISPTLSKVYERSMFKQMSSFFEDIFSKHQCGFRKGFRTQKCFLTLLEKWRNAVDKGKLFGALLTDLSKAFDSFNHELLIAKLNAYGFTLPSLKLIHNYLSDRKQLVRVNDSYSLWQYILFGVPQGSILGPLLFNIILADLFFTLNNTEIANYADDTTPYAVSDNIDGLISSL